MKLIWGVTPCLLCSSLQEYFEYSVLKLDVKKRRWLVQVQHKSWVKGFHYILHLNVYLCLILSWTGWERTSWAAENTNKQSAQLWRAWLLASTTAFVVHPQIHEFTRKNLGRWSSAVNRSKPGLKEAWKIPKLQFTDERMWWGCWGDHKRPGWVFYEDSTNPDVLGCLLRNDIKKVSISSEPS